MTSQVIDLPSPGWQRKGHEHEPHRSDGNYEIGPEGGEALVVGFDVAVFTEDGRFERVHGFLDKVPG
ncbi:hypothetical protein [Actinomadura latina]|uniref:hypothetical protein n=1 Tax=Actinomadura latina TaxID=163603 RepID=UPI00082D679E|nr:hypothetical protein [Actinomadura latina]